MIFEYKDKKFNTITLQFLKRPLDKRYDTIASLLKKYDRDDIAYVICDSKVLECVKTLVNTKLYKKYDKVIVHMTELYWDDFNADYPLLSTLKDNIHIIFNFFSKESPYKLLKNTYTSIGSFGDITELYLKKYNLDKKEPKYNLISKLGRPNEERNIFCKGLRDYKSFVYSINAFQEQYGEFEKNSIEQKLFESEVELHNKAKNDEIDNDFK